MADLTLEDLLEGGLDSTHPIVIKYINQKGYNQLEKAIFNNKLDTVKLLTAHGSIKTIVEINRFLYYASNYGYLDIIKFLVEEGTGTLVADINNDNYHCFRIACQRGQIEVVKYLISKGIDINLENSYSLRYAISNSHFDLVKYLVENGALVQGNENDNEPLRVAAVTNNLEVVKYLLDHGAQITDSIRKNAHKDILAYFDQLKKGKYFGIESESKLEIKLPELLEIESNNNFYYVYKCVKDKNGWTVANITVKINVLSNFGQVKFFDL